MLIGAIALVAASMAAGDGFRIPRDLPTWGAIAYLAIAGSVVTFLGFFSLLKTWSVTSLSFISVFTPAIALGLGFVLLDERPTRLTALGGGLILARRDPGADERAGSSWGPLRRTDAADSPGSPVFRTCGCVSSSVLGLTLRRNARTISPAEEMDVAKVSEISATSKASFEDAVQLGLAVRRNTG